MLCSFMGGLVCGPVPRGSSYNTHAHLAALISSSLSISPLPPSSHLTLPHSSRKDLHNAVSARADDQPSVAAPANVADAFAPHGTVRHDVLRADALLERPEAYACVVAGRDGFAAVLGEAERRDGGWVREHSVCALTWCAC